MWTSDPARGFLTPPAAAKSKPRRSPLSAKANPRPKGDLFHVIHKVPAGDSPYVKAKHVQLIDKDPSKAISLFWAAINSGDRVDSALKDMAVVMKQLDRSDEAIEAIKSFRHLCPLESQESLDNVLVELYKRSGRIEEQIEMLQQKVKSIEEGMSFDGKRTKLARSQGKKILITIEQEYSRLLGNLAWAYFQQNDYKSAEELYRKALSLESDKNKQCNLAICLMHMKRMAEAKLILQKIKSSSKNEGVEESYARSFERATQTLLELESQSRTPFTNSKEQNLLLEEHGRHSYSELSPQTLFGDKFKKGASYRENIYYGRRAGSFGKKAYQYSSPLAATGIIPEVPYTQPRRCSWSFDGGDKRKSNRKLFCGLPSSIQNWDMQSPVSTNGMSSNLSSKKSESGSESSVNGDWRKSSHTFPAKDCSEFVLQSTVDGVWGVRREKRIEMNSAVKEGDLVIEPTTVVAADRLREKEAFSCRDHGQASIISMEKGVEHKVNGFSDEKGIQLPANYSAQRSKKSWADMVEEDEQEQQQKLPNGKAFCYPERRWVYPCQDLQYSLQTPPPPSKDSDGEWKSRDSGCNNENLNLNLMHHHHLTPVKQMENLSEKMGESFNLKGDDTQPENVLSSTNQSVREYQREEEVITFGTGNGIKLLSRRNRLKVFRDITPFPETPRQP